MWKSSTDTPKPPKDGPPYGRFYSGETPNLQPDENRAISPPSVLDMPSFSSGEAIRPGLQRSGSRWGDVSGHGGLEGSSMNSSRVSTPQSLDNHAIRLRLEEIDRKISLINISCEQSSKVSSNQDVKLDSRKRLEDERAGIVASVKQNNSNGSYLASIANLPRRARPFEKVYVPVKEFPDINFFGLLVGPRGNSLKRMERESGAKISIRGKGSIKEGKARIDHSEDAEEDLHCLVTSDTEEKVAACVKMINKVIETAACTPEGQNDHKRNQLRELAALNGTLRDDENQHCQNCGGNGHRKFDCPEHRSYNSQVICRVCGGSGHIARDCIAHRSMKTGPASMSTDSTPVNGSNFAPFDPFPGAADYGERYSKPTTSTGYPYDLDYKPRTSAWSHESIWSSPGRFKSMAKRTDTVPVSNAARSVSQPLYDGTHIQSWNAIPNNSVNPNPHAQAQDSALFFPDTLQLDRLQPASSQLNDN